MKNYSYRDEQKVLISEQLEDMMLTLQLLRGKEQSYVLHSFNSKVKAKEPPTVVLTCLYNLHLNAGLWACNAGLIYMFIQY